MFGSADVALPQTERGVFVPESAVVALQNGESFAVYAVDRDVVRVRVVQPGERRNGMVRVLAGLDAGVVVATSKVNELYEGARVRTAATAAGEPAAGEPAAGRARGNE
jgi:hypothetical protein